MSSLKCSLTIEMVSEQAISCVISPYISIFKNTYLHSISCTLCNKHTYIMGVTVCFYILYVYIFYSAVKRLKYLIVINRINVIVRIISYQREKVYRLALCKCFFIENNIGIYCNVQLHTNILTWSIHSHLEQIISIIIYIFL